MRCQLQCCSFMLTSKPLAATLPAFHLSAHQQQWVRVVDPDCGSVDNHLICYAVNPGIETLSC
jgi:hypothetical protein